MSDPASREGEGDPLARWTRIAARGLFPPKALRGTAAPAEDVDPWTPVVLALLATLGSYAVAYLGFLLFADRFPESVLGIWNRWDAVHYLQIARDGYGTTPDDRFLIIWLPLYPWIVRALAPLAGDVHTAGLIVSFACYLGACVVLYRLVALDFPERIARRTIVYLAIFPTAYFLHAAYTESLFLVLVFGSFLAARRGRWAWAGVLGGLASLTRITAFGLIPALAVEYLLQKRFRLRDIRPDVLYLALIPVGFAIYLVVNQVVLGDPLAFLELAGQRHYKQLAAPWVGIERVWGTALSSSPRWLVTITVYEIGLGVTALLVGLVVALRLRASYAVFMLFAWANFGFNSWWISTARYLLVLFPGFILLALWGERRSVHWSLGFAFLTSYTILMLLFVQGRWTF